MSLRPLSSEIMKSFLREEMRKACYIDFTKIGMWQIADEELIREFADKMNWHAVFHYIQCSKDFIREVLDNYYDDLDWDTIFCICATFCLSSPPFALTTTFILSLFTRIT